MEPLLIDAIYRRYLIDRGALVLDQDGNEVLIGLTVDESIEYVSAMSSVDIAGIIRGGVDPVRLLMLYDRHAAARPDLPSIFSSVAPSDWQPRRK